MLADERRISTVYRASMTIIAPLNFRHTRRRTLPHGVHPVQPESVPYINGEKQDRPGRCHAACGVIQESSPVEDDGRPYVRYLFHDCVVTNGDQMQTIRRQRFVAVVM
jgi:hypothetical protein